MGLRKLFHKIRIGFVRKRAATIPYVSEEKRYGNYGEDEVIRLIKNGLPTCEVKKNIIINTPDGNAEIDCLVLYKNKLFAIEIKHWVGKIIENSNGFMQEKIDRWTGEIHRKYHKSPFKQLGRAIYLLRKQIPDKAWVNSVVFFLDDDSEIMITEPENVWISNIDCLIKHIQNEGKPSPGSNAKAFFQKCVQADYLYSNLYGRTLQCFVLKDSLCFNTLFGKITRDDIVSIKIRHHWSYDELHIRLKSDYSVIKTEVENGYVEVTENGYIHRYAFSKLDSIELGTEE